MPEHALMDSSSLNRGGYGRAVLAALTGGDPAREEIVAAAVNDNPRWDDIRNHRAALTFPELIRALEALHEAGFETGEVQGDPLLQKSFFDTLRRNADDAKQMAAQLEKLRETAKAEKGFLKIAFNLFSAGKPLEKILADIGTFAEYCNENNITFDAAAERLIAGKKPETVWHKTAHHLYEFRFLIAAVAGGTAGALGLNPADASPELAAYPGVFFSKVLPAFVVPFTALSLFKTASRDDAVKDSLLFGRFGLSMALGAALSMSVINAEKYMGWVGPDSKPAVETVLTAATPESGKATSVLASAFENINPSAYMLDGVGLGLGGGIAYGVARYLRRRRGDGNAGENEFGIGKGLVKASNFMDSQFGNVITYGGIPAIGLLLSQTIAEKGVGEFGHYAGMYATVFGTLAVAQGMVAAGLYKSGFRTREDWKLVSDVAARAFATSSSAATIDTIKESLAKKGVSEQTRDLTPIVTNFHMFGPTVCLGALALYANAYFGYDQTLLQQAETLSLVIASMLAVRGVPTATGALLTPVLSKDGNLTPNQIGTVNAAVIGPDRLLDMCETVINTTADLLVLHWHDKSKWAENIAAGKEKIKEKISPQVKESFARVKEKIIGYSSPPSRPPKP